MFAIMPLAAVYYPVAVLPAWLQPVAWAMPPAYAFEGMRAVLIGHHVDMTLMLRGLALDVVYLGLGFAAFIRCFELARRRGLILQQGE
jgi:ABC-2 type transport system permease protein